MEVKGICKDCGKKCHKHSYICRTCTNIRQRKLNKYKIIGDYVEMESSNNKGCFVFDLEDLEKIRPYTWAIFDGRNKYVICDVRKGDKVDRMKMHRLILNMPSAGRDPCVDHINHDGLDNRKVNLRICTNQQNNYNSRPQKGKKYKGTFLDIRTNKYISNIGPHKNRIFLGSYEKEDDAASHILYKEFAYTNFPKQEWEHLIPIAEDRIRNRIYSINNPDPYKHIQKKKLKKLERWLVKIVKMGKCIFCKSVSSIDEAVKVRDTFLMQNDK